MNESFGPFDDDLTQSLDGSGNDLFDRLAEEFAERCRAGDPPSISEYEARHPDHAERIRKLLSTVAMMEQLKRGLPAADSGGLAPPVPARLGEFRVVRELGRGGMGVVYEAVQESLGRHVALKVVHHVHLDPRRLERFRREAEAVARLHHTNIVPIFGVGEHEGLPYYVMQYIQGSGLDQWLASWRREGAPRGEERWPFVANVGLQAARAVEYAHEQGVLHRDIKPANLLVDEHRTIWVADFGLAKLSGRDDLTASGDVIGTLRYLAPEALAGETGPRSDVYSLGVTLYELLTLTVPFGDLSPSELLRQVSEGQLVRPRRLAPDIPRDLETIVLKATAREPERRYETAGELAEDLRLFLEDRPIQARRATPIERAWRWGRRNPAMAALSATAALAVGLAAVAGWVGYATKTRALENESKLLRESRIATERAEANVALSLGVFSELFARLSTRDSLPPPPLGRSSRDWPPGRRDRPPHRDGGHRPPALGEGAENGGPPPPPGEWPDDPFGPPAPMGDKGPRPDRGPRMTRTQGAEEDTALLQSILTFYDRFARQNATNPRLQGEAAWAYRKVGALYEMLGRDADAEEAYGHAITRLEGLVAKYPRDVDYRIKLVDTYDMADPWSAEPSTLERLFERLRRAQDLIDGLLAERPGDVDDSLARIHIYAKLGVTAQRLGRMQEAEAYYGRAIDIESDLIERRAKDGRARMDRATTREALATLEIGRGRRAEALRLLDAAADDLRACGSRGGIPAPPERFEHLADAFRSLGETGRADELERLALEHPPHGRGRPDRNGPPRRVGKDGPF